MSRIVIDPARTLGTIDRKVFGGFVEHLGRCIYGGLYEAGSPRSDERGFRTDVLALLRELRLGVLRWPGGNFVSNYHWTDGIGPRQDRPRRPELAWGGEEPNTFGTDEFLAYCAALGPEPDSVAPYICLNMGTGSLAEALAWVEYCNSARNTHWAAQRRANGRDEPYGVRYWALGNEMYGPWQVGQLTAQEYVREATRWARAIRMLDPGARLVACGETGLTDWDPVVIDGLAGLVDYYSIHLYTGSDDYWTNVLQPHQAERAIKTTAALIDRAAYLQGLDRGRRSPTTSGTSGTGRYLEARGLATTGRRTRAARSSRSGTRIIDALAVATYLNIFVRNCATVRMANLAQLVNAIAPIVTTGDAAAVQPIYYPFLLHARAALDAAADVHVDGPVISPELPDGASRWPHRIADLGPFSLVDAAASVSADRGRIAVTLVNRGLDAGAGAARAARLHVRGTGRGHRADRGRRPAPEPSSAQVPDDARRRPLSEFNTAHVPGVTRVPGIAGVRLADGHRAGRRLGLRRDLAAPVVHGHRGSRGRVALSLRHPLP